MLWQLREPAFRRAIDETVAGRCALAGSVGAQLHVASLLGIDKQGPPAHAIELVAFGGAKVPREMAGVPVRSVDARGFEASIEADRAEIEVEGMRYPVASPEHILGTTLASAAP